MKDPSDRIWAYLHDQMNDEERAAFLDTLHSDPELRGKVDRRMETHNQLKELLSDAENDSASDILEDCLLASWEAEHPEHKERSNQKSGIKKLLVFTPLAAAAALVVLLSLPAQNGSIHWQRTVFGTAPQLRGTTDSSMLYSRSELDELSDFLRQTIEQSYKPASEDSPRWVLQIQLQELADGALTVEVSGYPTAAPGDTRTWADSFLSMDAFRSQIPTFGQRLAGELSARSN